MTCTNAAPKNIATNRRNPFARNHSTTRYLDHGIGADFIAIETTFSDGIASQSCGGRRNVLGAALGAVIIRYSISAALWLGTVISAFVQYGIVTRVAHARISCDGESRLSGWELLPDSRSATVQTTMLEHATTVYKTVAGHTASDSPATVP